MTLGELLDRVYDVLGDLKDDPQVYTRTRTVTLVNEALLVFRRFIEDEWFIHRERLVASQAVYTFPATSISRAVLISYDDEPLQPESILELRGKDTKWETRTGSRPWNTTVDGQAHNKYRLYPIPDTATTDDLRFEADPNVAGWSATHGVVGRWQDDGVDLVFAADPNVGGWNPQHGRVYAKGSDNFSQPHGRIASVTPTGVGGLTLWLVELPPTVDDDGDQLPIKDAFAQALVWYVLHMTYEEEGDHHNPILAAYYRDEFTAALEECRELMANPMPYQIHKLRGGDDPFTESQNPAPFATSAIIDGQPVNFGWPKRGW